MSHQLLSQVRVLLLLAASLVAGLIVSTWFSQHELARRNNPAPDSAQSLAVESP